VGGQDDVKGGNPQIGMDGGGDPQMGAHGGDGRRQQCKNLVATARNRRQKLNISSVVPNLCCLQKLFRNYHRVY
jgi:hypothetical protein